MSSVSGSGSNSGSRADDVNRRNREEYVDKEAEMVKNHQKELRRITEQHQTEMKRLSEIHDQRITDLRRKSSDAITRRDRKYQNEIDQLKDLNRQRNVQQSLDSEDKLGAVKASLKNQVESEKTKGEKRVEDLQKVYGQQMTDQKTQYSEQMKELTETQKAAFEENRKQALAAREKELTTTKEERDKKIADLDSANRELRKSSERRLDQQEVRHVRDKNRLANNMIHLKKNMEGDHSEQINDIRQSFTEAIHDENRKSTEREEQIKQRYLSNHDSLVSKTEDRINNRIANLETKISDLNRKSVKDQVKSDRQKQKELNNQRDSMMASLNDLQEQKRQLGEAHNDKTRKEILKIRDEHSNAFNKQDRQAKEALYLNTETFKKAYRALSSDPRAERQAIVQKADERVQIVRAKSDAEKERISRLYNTNLQDIMDQIKMENLEVRNKVESERDMAVLATKERFKETQIKQDEKLRTAVTTYDQKVKDIQDQLTREKRLATNRERQLIKEQQLARKRELEAQQAMFQEKIQQLQNQHKMEKDALVANQHEKTQQLLSTIKKT